MGAPTDTTFTQEAVFGPISLSQEQLSGIILKIEALAKTANRSVAAERIERSLSLSDGTNSIRISGDIVPGELAAAPTVVTSASYTYRAFNAPISGIELQLWDSQRKVTIGGTSREQVEAVASVATTALSDSGTFFGGSVHRGIAGFALVLLGMFLPVLGLLAQSGRTKLVLALIGSFLSLSVWVLPWDRWFPGAVVYRGDASFMVRQAPLISLLGLIATIVTFFLSVAISRNRHAG